ncbi:MAG: SDR family oxidoreductase [Planctomycetota bacterium]|nr:SDR family oxidoreductase [Planctomycetaceae bacterium]MDQ3330597.1 SDR family oxidoreductase [Planctomycetota bacterium]
MRKRTLLKLATVAAGGYIVAKRMLPPGYTYAGKVAIVTGGSRGLGLELARNLVLSGAHVAICARDEAELEVAREELEARGADVYAAACDVTERSDVERFVGDVVSRFGRVDVLINNAGIIAASPTECLTEDDYDRSLATHLYGPMYFIEAVLPHMKARRQGRIANIASIGGKLSPPHILSYTAGKFALVGYSEGLGVELAKDGIRVTTVCPGLMRTGSMINAEFKGQHRKEYGWFAAGASIPVVTIDSTEAARRILDAVARGRREYIFPIFWKIVVTGHELFRDTSLAVMEQMNKLFPTPGGIGPESRLGRDSESAFTRSAFTQANREAAVRNNE